MHLTSLPVLLFIVIVSLAFLACAIHGLLVGKTWLSGKFYRRDDNAKEFYKVIATYVFLSVLYPLMLGYLVWIRSL